MTDLERELLTVLRLVRDYMTRRLINRNDFMYVMGRINAAIKKGEAKE